MEQLQNVENNDVEVINNALEDDFYYDGDVEKETPISEKLPLEEIKMDDIDLEETFGIAEEINLDTLTSSADVSISNKTEPFVSTENNTSTQLAKDNADFDAIFDSLYNDVAGANNFISTLIEQKKNVTDNEASLKEEKEKLAKEREEFERFVKSQKENIELEKAQCNEYVRTQKLRLQNEEAQFNADAEAISINGNRIISTSSVVVIGDEILKVDGAKIQSPYVINAIGNADYLKSAVSGKGGQVDELKEVGHETSVDIDNNIFIEKYKDELKTKYID